MCKFCWVTVAILALISTGVTYKFVFQGKVTESDDARTVILLDRNERDLVLSEMRGFLESLQQVTSGISSDDMKLVAASARKSGMGSQSDVPGSLVGKLPLAFKQLGFDTHTKFDELALDAEQLGDRDHALAQMNTLLMNCISCHATYRFELTVNDGS